MRKPYDKPGISNCMSTRSVSQIVSNTKVLTTAVAYAMRSHKTTDEYIVLALQCM